MGRFHFWGLTYIHPKFVSLFRLDANTGPENCFKRSKCGCADYGIGGGGGGSGGVGGSLTESRGGGGEGGQCNEVVPVKGNGLVFQVSLNRLL